MGNKIRLHIIASLVLLASCQGDELNLPTGKGMLQLQELKVVDATQNTLRTRAVDSDLSLILTGPESRQYAAGEEVPEKWPLAVGHYTLQAFTPNQTGWKTDNEGRGSACHIGSTEFDIQEDWVTYVNYQVPMTNYGVQLVLPDEFKKYFSNNRFVVTSAGRSPIVAENQTAYFDPAEGGFSFVLTVTNVDGETFTTKTQQFSNVAAGKVYKVCYSYSDDPGDASLTVTITYDDQMETVNEDLMIEFE